MEIKRIRKTFVFITPLIGIFLFTYLTPAAPDAAVITLNPGTTYQTISGWQAVAEIGIEVPGFLSWRDEVVDLAVNDLGINRIMFQVFWYYEDPNDNNDPYLINWSGFDFSKMDLQVSELVIPLKQSLESRGENLHINLKYINSSSITIHSTNPEEYAELIEATFLHLQNTYGWVPDSVDIVNEPRVNRGWTPEKIGDALVATANRLQNHGFTPTFFVPSYVNVQNSISWFDQMISSVPESLQYIDELAYHCYGGCNDDSYLIAVADRTVTYGISSSMTEKIGHDYEDMHRDLKLARVSGWEQFALAFPLVGEVTDNGAQYYLVDVSDPDNPVVIMGNRTKFLRQYFKFVRGGAVRIEASSGNGNFDPVAFINTDNSYVVVVKADQGGDISIQGLPAGEYGIKYTTSGEYDVDLPNVTIGAGQNLNTSIPSLGVITVYEFSLDPDPIPTSSPPPGDSTPTPTSTQTNTPPSNSTPTSTPIPTSFVPAVELFIPLIVFSR